MIDCGTPIIVAFMLEDKPVSSCRYCADILQDRIAKEFGFTRIIKTLHNRNLQAARFVTPTL
jgi:hypothetical protein